MPTQLELSALTALSPLDGRYGASTAALREVFSEFAFMRARVRVEVEWLLALARLGLRYDSEAARAMAGRTVESVKLAAYEASAEIAREKGAFPAWERDRYLAGSFASRLPGVLRDRIAQCGLRNSHLLAIAPTG